ncbi:hypothetical protein PAPYR_9046 [Paratrimastix pyriformis]|uniref:Uncharacterized protein n=1 Tax=Paratrimastix pyriformis TaxID=342808 RepID=A0ABQ8UBW5_9EUKA|nr:hypothetical protein PAPYR_9046 [Paratrimastix pyriformis]
MIANRQAEGIQPPPCSRTGRGPRLTKAPPEGARRQMPRDGPTASELRPVRVARGLREGHSPSAAMLGPSPNPWIEGTREKCPGDQDSRNLSELAIESGRGGHRWVVEKIFQKVKVPFPPRPSRTRGVLQEWKPDHSMAFYKEPRPGDPKKFCSLNKSLLKI